ncbi:hypothetical protein ACT4S2_16855 [Kocuria turfanensis]|uniref:hypothetical protein n=1 Tax=Kocuria turfanensis TaxID=388357 RepID=UPI004035E2FF
MTEQDIDSQHPRVRDEGAERLIDRCAGVFLPEPVDRCGDQALWVEVSTCTASAPPRRGSGS